MPDSTSCQKLELVAKSLKRTDHVGPTEKRPAANFDSTCLTERRVEKLREHPEKKIAPFNRTECSVVGDETSLMLDHLRDDVCPGPLGPTRNANRSASTDFWSPLADLTGSRPAVEQTSTTRYSPAESRLHNDRVFMDSSESVLKESLVAFNAHRCMARVFAQTDKNQQDNNVKLDSRLKLVHCWKVELKRDINAITNELKLIENERKRLSRGLHALGKIESIDEDIKSVRCLRMEHELVRDEVEDELHNELNLCADIRNLYVRLADHVKKQLQELKDAKRRLELDLTDKKEAWNIDVTCRGLNSKSSSLEWKAGSVQMPENQSTPDCYEYYCKEAIAMSQAALQRSKILRLNLQDTYENSVRDLRAQAAKVDSSLSRKIDENVQACRRLELELARCLKAMSEAEDLMDKTQEATKRLDGGMKCAQTRLDLRNQRSKVENCRDTPHFGLVDEVKTLSEGVSTVLSQLERAKESVKDLTKARETLEKDLVIKRKSLWVDRDRCQRLRSFYPNASTLAGH